MGLTRRNNKLLECFYCGRKSTIRYNGQSSFECASCDAVNYLDEHGDITDPPASGSKEPAPATMAYATSQRASPRSKRSETIFCETCLNNQRLFTASLAQYLPDDPDAPDYIQRERDYYDFRKRLEKIYPQICAECEPKVRRRIEQSAYTAKTDVLRHMIDASKTNKVVIKRTWLDVLHSAGRWLWLAGFALEILSHIVTMSVLGLEYCTTEENAPLGCTPVVSVALPIHKLLPEHGRLLRWSFYAGLFSSWWNPRFVQTVRGFTKHLIGLPNWYAYQVMGVGIRFFSRRFFESHRLALVQEFGAHLLLLAIAATLYRVATTCVRVDTTPLFGSKSKMQTRQVDSPQKVNKPHTISKPDGVKNMSDLLDEILESPSLSVPSLPPLAKNQPYRPPNPLLHGQGSNTFGVHSGISSTTIARKPNLDLDSFSISDPSSRPTPSNNPFIRHQPPQQQPPSLPQPGEEMDWSPSTFTSTPSSQPQPQPPQHRAFTSFRTPTPGQPQSFNATPISPTQGAFWYRVPPAPVSPAARILNPPNQPRLRGTTNTTGSGGSSGSPTEKITFREGSSRAVVVPVNDEQGDGNGEGGTRQQASVAFAKPSFFCPPANVDDPRDGLADLLGRGARLSQEEQQEQERRRWMGGLFGR